MKRFRELVEHRHDYARDWQAKTGGKVVGYFCTYVPEELIYAAGMLPVRIIGSHEPQDVTEPYIFGIFCPFCRDCLAQGLQGRYNYLNGLVKARSCMHIRHTFAFWRENVPLDYSHYVVVPALVQSPRAQRYLEKELAAFKTSLEEWTGKPISEEALDQAIEVYNTNRRLMGQIYELRKADNPPISGAEAMEMTLSSQLTDKAEHNRILSEVLKDLPQRKDGPEPGVRLMVIGTENDDTGFLRLIESLGGSVVVDDHCTGRRYFWNEVVPGEDRLAAIAARYIGKLICPAKDFPQRRRLPGILKLCEDYNVQGVIMLQQKFCEPFEFDVYALTTGFKEQGIPTLFLEYDLAMAEGQFRGRIEAFLEMLQLSVM